MYFLGFRDEKLQVDSMCRLSKIWLKTSWWQYLLLLRQRTGWPYISRFRDAKGQAAWPYSSFFHDAKLQVDHRPRFRSSLVRQAVTSCIHHAERQGDYLCHRSINNTHKKPFDDDKSDKHTSESVTKYLRDELAVYSLVRLILSCGKEKRCWPYSRSSIMSVKSTTSGSWREYRYEKLRRGAGNDSGKWSTNSASSYIGSKQASKQASLVASQPASKPVIQPTSREKLDMFAERVALKNNLRFFLFNFFIWSLFT